MRLIELRTVGAAFAMALTVAACSDPGADLGETVTLSVDGGSNPTTAIDTKSGASYVTWVGTENEESDVWLVRIEEDGSRREPVRVNNAPGDAAAHFQAPSQVAVGPTGDVYVLWTNNTYIEGRRFPASDLRFARSEDGGRTFSSAVTVNDDASGPPTSHTFHNMLVGPDGALHISWLDSRGSATEGNGAHHAEDHTAEYGHEMTAADSPDASGPELRVAVSHDQGRTFSSGVVVDRNTCPCCRTTMVNGPSGEIYVAWRKVFAGNVRDVVVARSDDHGMTWGEPQKVHDDGWVFPGCPHAGPSLAVDEAGALHAVWYTGKAGAAGLFYTRSDDGGKSFGEATPLVSGDVVTPSVTAMTVEDGEVWIAWEDRTLAETRLRLTRVDASAAGRVVDTWPGSHPSFSARGGQRVLAWHRGDTVRVRVGK